MSDKAYNDKKWWKMPLEVQIKEFPNIRRADVAALRDWLDKQPHMPPLPDDLLGLFLASCGYSIESAKRAIEINYTLRTRHPRMFAERDIHNQELQSVKKYYQMGILPHKKGRPVVVVYGLRQMDASDYDLEVVLRGSYMVQDISNLRLGPAPEGYVYILDMKHWTFGHILRSPLTICAAFLKYAQEGSCCKILQMHMMNSGPVLEKFLSMIRPFISEEVWKVITLHEKTDGLRKYLEPEEIPNDFEGGTAPSVDELTDECVKLLEEYTDWFKLESVLRVREDKRPPGSKSPIEDLGIQGSFKKLDID